MRSHELLSKSLGSSFLQFCYLDLEEDMFNFQCFHPDTEVLTVDGFKSVEEVQMGEFVATMNPKTRKMEFRSVTKTHAYDFDGEMISPQTSMRQGKGVSFCVTPNHTMWIGTHKKKELRPYRADQMPKNNIYPTFCTWEGTSPQSEFVFEGEGNNGKTRRINSRAWTQFLGWYISEGSRRNHLKGGYRIYISQKKEEGKSEIREILNTMGIKYHENKQGFSFASKPICRYLEQFGNKANEKSIPTEIKSWDAEHLSILLDTLVAGDGTWYRRWYQGTFVTSSKKLADDVCEIAIKCGWRACIREAQGNEPDSPFGTNVRYRVQLHNKQGDTTSGRGTAKTPYKGKVYCVTVPPHHTVLTRHNGVIVWTGGHMSFRINHNVQYCYPVVHN